MAQFVLGRFGDRRLEKGGSFYMTAWSRRLGGGFGSAGWESTGPERSGCLGSYATMR